MKSSKVTRFRKGVPVEFDADTINSIRLWRNRQAKAKAKARLDAPECPRINDPLAGRGKIRNPFSDEGQD